MTRPAAPVAIAAMPAPHTGRRRTSTHSIGNENVGWVPSASVALRSSTNAVALATAAGRTSTIASIGGPSMWSVEFGRAGSA